MENQYHDTLLQCLTVLNARHVTRVTEQARSIGSRSRRRSFTDPALSDIGMNLMTFRELEIHLVKRNPPLERSSPSLSTNTMALFSDGTDLRELST